MPAGRIASQPAAARSTSPRSRSRGLIDLAAAETGQGSAAHVAVDPAVVATHQELGDPRDTALDLLQGVRVMARACRHRGVGLRAKGVPRQPTQGRVEGRRRVEAGQRRLGDRACRVDVALPRRELGRCGGQRSPVPARPRVGGRQRVSSTEMLGGVPEAALVGVDACTVDVEPDRRGTDRVQLEALVGGRGSLVPSPEVEEGLRDCPSRPPPYVLATPAVA